MKKQYVFRSLIATLCLVAFLISDAAPFSVVPLAEAEVTQSQIDALKKEQSALSAEKAELQSQLSGVRQKKSDAVARKENLDRQVSVILSEIENVEAQIAAYDELIEQTERELRETQERAAEQYEIFCTRVRAMEERGTISYWAVLFHSASFSDLLSAMDFIGEIMESDQRVIDELRDLLEQIEAQEAQLKQERAEQEEARAELESRKTELNAQLEAARQVIRELEEDEAAYRELIRNRDSELAKQQAEIVRLSRELAEQQRAAAQAAEGGYIWPCSSHYITSPYGARHTGISGASTNHAGVDIGRVYYSTQVVAAKAGTVIISGYNSYRGNYVVISHGSGSTTTYQHLSKRSVSVGDKVKQGQAIGVTGSTGVSNGPHLHFEITENGRLVNPLKYLTNYTRGW